MALWDKPLYHLVAKNGKPVIIDVTQSVQSGLGPNQAIHEVIEFFKRKKVKRVLDFGAGALRHTFPLLEAGFQVWAVDFEEQYADTKSKQICREARQKAEDCYPNFNGLIYPRAFIKYKLKKKKKFDAVLLCYTFQGMPLQNERRRLLRLLYGKLRKPSPMRNSYIVWMSRYDAKHLSRSQRVEDGYFKFPKGSVHSFYREWKTSDIHEMMESIAWRKSFHHLRSLGKGGRDQIFVYSKMKGFWI